FGRLGRMCGAVSGIIVEARVYVQCLEAVAARAGNVAYGDQLDDSVMVGPIVNDSQVESVSGKIDLAREQGAREVVAGPIEGRVIAPHVFADVTPDMELFREEIFGPV